LSAELRDCLEVVLGMRPPEPEGEPFLFYRQWLAERNLGLVPIAGASDFSWPGHWLARAGEHVVVMFGSPSGPLHDPHGALAGDGTIDEGWLVAPLDVHLPIEPPAARLPLTGTVAGHGLEGDRYREGRGTFSGPGRGYELTLVEAEMLDELGLPWERARRNVVTRGIELNALVGRRFRVGAAECVGRRLCEPCAHLERLSGSGLLRPLVHRAGRRADILRGGRICAGDDVLAS
jgi:hypothetical protein